jgi:hypothetical protein
MKFVPMDRERVVAILEEHDDVLTEQARVRREFYASKECARCGNPCAPEADIRMNPDGSGRVKYLCRCTGCRSLFDPDLGIVVEIGNMALLEPNIPIIRGD